MERSVNSFEWSVGQRCSDHHCDLKDLKLYVPCPLLLDAANTIPLTDPAQCENEIKTAAALAKVGLTLRAKIADPTKCSDALVASLASTCANTIDGLVNATGTGGCLLTGGVTAVDGLIGTVY